jgi:spore maturation protein CgeB
MKLVIFGLTMSSSWGNGHATLWRSLCRAWIDRGHEFVFFEKDVPYYANRRDLTHIPGAQLILYSSWADVLSEARRQLDESDVGMVTSYCPDGIEATEELLFSRTPLRVYYDLDTPVTLDRWLKGEKLSYIGERGLADFDLVLSYTGGKALEEVKRVLWAKKSAPLYGSVDPHFHKPVPVVENYRCHLSYLGTYAEDRQTSLERYFIEPARRLPSYKFLIGGSMYPLQFPWQNNIFFIRHVPPQEHSAFYSSSNFTLNITRRSMANMGYCPSGRLFEAAACGVPIVSDWWEGLDEFFLPGQEIFIVKTSEEMLDILNLPWEQRSLIAESARIRALTEHSAEKRAEELESILEKSLKSVSYEPTKNKRTVEVT